MKFTGAKGLVLTTTSFQLDCRFTTTRSTTNGILYHAPCPDLTQPAFFLGDISIINNIIAANALRTSTCNHRHPTINPFVLRDKKPCHKSRGEETILRDVNNDGSLDEFSCIVTDEVNTPNDHTSSSRINLHDDDDDDDNGLNDTTEIDYNPNIKRYHQWLKENSYLSTNHTNHTSTPKPQSNNINHNPQLWPITPSRTFPKCIHRGEMQESVKSPSLQPLPPTRPHRRKGTIAASDPPLIMKNPGNLINLLPTRADIKSFDRRICDESLERLMTPQLTWLAIQLITHDTELNIIPNNTNTDNHNDNGDLLEANDDALFNGSILAEVALKKKNNLDSGMGNVESGDVSDVNDVSYAWKKQYAPESVIRQVFELLPQLKWDPPDFLKDAYQQYQHIDHDAHAFLRNITGKMFKCHKLACFHMFSSLGQLLRSFNHCQLSKDQTTAFPHLTTSTSSSNIMKKVPVTTILPTSITTAATTATTTTTTTKHIPRFKMYNGNLNMMGLMFFSLV